MGHGVGPGGNSLRLDSFDFIDCSFADFRRDNTFEIVFNVYNVYNPNISPIGQNFYYTPVSFVVYPEMIVFSPWQEIDFF